MPLETRSSDDFGWNHSESFRILARGILATVAARSYLLELAEEEDKKMPSSISEQDSALCPRACVNSLCEHGQSNGADRKTAVLAAVFLGACRFKSKV